MTSGIREILNNKQLPNGNSVDKSNNQLPIDSVDKLADELVIEYSNPDYRTWYCKIIYTFGFERVQEWRRRAAEGRAPARLFSKYAKEALQFRGSRGFDG